MAKATKKETDSTTKSTKATKPAAKAKTATKASDTPKSTASRPSEVQRKDPSRPAESQKASPVAKTAEPAPEPPKTAKRPAARVGEVTPPRIRKTPPRSNNVTVEPAGQHSVSATPEQIAQRAYFLFIERGGYHGCDVDDWLEAERQITGTHG